MNAQNNENNHVTDLINTYDKNTDTLTTMVDTDIVLDIDIDHLSIVTTHIE